MLGEDFFHSVLLLQDIFQAPFSSNIYLIKEKPTAWCRYTTPINEKRSVVRLCCLMSSDVG